MSDDAGISWTDEQTLDDLRRQLAEAIRRETLTSDFYHDLQRIQQETSNQLVEANAKLVIVQRQRADFEKALEAALTQCDEANAALAEAVKGLKEIDIAPPPGFGTKVLRDIARAALARIEALKVRQPEKETPA